MTPNLFLSVHLACTQLAHFASQVCTLLILQLAPFPSAQVPRVQNPTFAPYVLAHFVFCVGIIVVVSAELFIASYCWTQTSQSSKASSVTKNWFNLRYVLLYIKSYIKSCKKTLRKSNFPKGVLHNFMYNLRYDFGV